ncbi:glutamate racemase [Shewanella cyperi]|uniref:glutamate racemase n=1 Tax=Shewanella cyperi TaxID=2814292 RepID=UPI001A941CEA|nr:glutamate racemase [Shewanella cyperi]QSX41037.1 glutamate racemase [Shewanella cyperi]
MGNSILVFDSGIGGLSVLQEIRARLPEHEYCYLFDNARLPYGELSEQELISGCVCLIEDMVARCNAAVVVIACNTASTLVLPALRSRLSIPVVGVVPAIKPAAAMSHSGHIGLLATPGTVRRAYTHELIASHAKDSQVHLFGSSELVMMAEAKMAGQPVDLSTLSKILAPVKETEIDVLVLGCTHFPLLAEELSQVLGETIRLVDSGEAIARRVVHLLGEAAMIAGPGKLTAWHTTDAISEGLSTSLRALGFNAILPYRIEGR